MKFPRYSVYPRCSEVDLWKSRSLTSEFLWNIARISSEFRRSLVSIPLGRGGIAACFAFHGHIIEWKRKRIRFDDLMLFLIETPIDALHRHCPSLTSTSRRRVVQSSPAHNLYQNRSAISRSIPQPYRFKGSDPEVPDFQPSMMAWSRTRHWNW